MNPIIQQDKISFMEATQTYLVVMLAFFLHNVSTITSVLGFALVVIRLSYEIPRAWKVLGGLFGRQPKDE